MQLLHLARAGGGDVAGEVGEAGVAAGELAQELVLGLVEQPGEARARPAVGSLTRYGVAAIVIAGWETASSMPLRVGDRAAAGGHDDVGLLLGGARRA